MDVSAGWFPDPTGRGDQRYWDGDHWTEHFTDLTGNQGIDPLPATWSEAPSPNNVVEPGPGTDDHPVAVPRAGRGRQKRRGRDRGPSRLAEPAASATLPTTAPSPSALDSSATSALTIGDITVTEDRIITPNGTGTLKGSKWFVRDMSRTEQKTPTSAIVLAIIFALFCLIGLLFLLQKETRTTGYVEVEVQSGSLHHTTQIAVSHAIQINAVRALVSRAQVLAGQGVDAPDLSTPQVQASGPNLTQRLNELADLRDRGALTDDEFQAQKARLLDNG